MSSLSDGEADSFRDSRLSGLLVKLMPLLNDDIGDNPRKYYSYLVILRTSVVETLAPVKTSAATVLVARQLVALPLP